MTFLFLKIAGLMLLAAGFGAWLARWFFRHRYEDVTVQYTGWQNDWAQWRKGLDSKLALRQMLDLSPVTERLGDLESLVRGAGMPKPEPVDLTPVMEAVERIKLPEPARYDFTPLYSRMYDVEQRVASIRIPPPADMAPLHDRIDALEAAVQRSVAAIDIPKPQPTDLSPVLDRLHSVEQRVSAIRIPDLAPVMNGLAAVVDTSRADLAPLYARIGDVEKAVRDLPRPAPVDLAPVMSGLAAVGAGIGSIRIPEPHPPANLQPLQARLDAIDKTVGAIRVPELDLNPVQARLDELEQRLHYTVNETIARIPAPIAPKDPDWSQVLTPLLARLAALESHIDALAPPPAVDLAPIDGRLDRIEALAQRVADAQLQPAGAANAPDMLPMMNRLIALDSKVQAIRIPPAPPSVNLTPLHDKLDTLSRVVGGLRAPPTTAAAAAQPPLDLGPLKQRLEARLDTLERAVTSIRIPAPAPVDLGPVVERLRGLESTLGKLEAASKSEAMTLRRAAPAATRTVEVPASKPAPMPAPAPRPEATPVSAPIAAAVPVPVSVPAAVASVAPLAERTPPPIAAATPVTTTPAPAAAKPAAPAPVPAADAQLGFGFDSRNIRSGSRNLLTHEAFGRGDDLKEIVGVAAGLERLLHDIGVYYFWQIAEWTAQDVAYVDQRLKAFKGRILRDDWIRQCVKLAKQAGAAQKPT